LFEGPAATSLAGAAPAAAGALAIGLESALGFSGRYREESWTFGRGADAMRRSAEHIGPAIVAASLAEAAVLACAWILPVGYARSIAVAGLVAVPLAGIASLVVMPALLTLTDQNDRATPRRAVRGPVASAQGPWYRFAAFWTRPSRMAVGTAVALCLLLAVVSSQAFRLDSISFSASELPSDSQARVAARRLDVALGPGAQAPLLGVSEGAPSQLGPYAKGLRRLTGVVTTKLSPAGRKHSLVSIQARPRPGSLPAQGVVGEVRAGSLDLGVQVGGTSARTRDAAAAIGSWLVLALLAALAVGGALLAWVGGGIRRAATTAVLAFLPAAAAAGVLALVFQDGRLSPLLHYSPQGAPHLAAAITALSALVAISVGRSAFLLGSVRHDAKLAAGPRWAMARALALTAPACAATSLIVVAAAGAMVAVDLLPVKEFGLALAVGALLDFIVLRLIALPLLAHPEGERLRLRHE
jgi:RND superfamily putative drug exporter